MGGPEHSRGLVGLLEKYWLLFMVAITGACTVHLFHWESHDKSLLAQHPINYTNPEESYWGKPTAAIDWCEDNYAVTRYIAEFWNTISSLMLVLAGLVGLRECIVHGLETRFRACYVSLIVVGTGSVLFHGTLLYELQMADELPMLWASLVWMYVLINNEIVEGKNRIDGQHLALYGITATIVFIIITDELPAVFQVHILVQALWTVYTVSQMLGSLGSDSTHSRVKNVFKAYGIFGMIAFICWVTENAMCSKVASLPINPQLHAWWHTCMAVNTYAGPLFVAYNRGLVLGKKPVVTFNSWGVPVVQYTLKEVKVQ